ncbi:Protein of unknown function [Pyronema omphalodes CBS 100304]|uniref:Uncharacterized protein n=1 Tax=Pyronema omphalodes (strain CBS 100304) TaxID=1076935 RepID=U4LWT1_PYROM|nr:Protein of unknown function [Pyronema omphalodes CBS 100304]
MRPQFLQWSNPQNLEFTARIKSPIAGCDSKRSSFYLEQSLAAQFPFIFTPSKRAAVDRRRGGFEVQEDAEDSTWGKKTVRQRRGG